nr:MAG TPA: hypothetical protein [Caudoviricetes sp.]
MLEFVETIDISNLIDGETYRSIKVRLDVAALYLEKLYKNNNVPYSVYRLFNIYDADIKNKDSPFTRSGVERKPLFKSQIGKYWYNKITRGIDYVYLIPSYVTQNDDSALFTYDEIDISITNLTALQLDIIGGNEFSAHIRAGEKNKILLDIFKIVHTNKSITIAFSSKNEKNITLHFYNSMNYKNSEEFSLKLNDNNLNLYDNIITNYIIPFQPDFITVQRLLPQDYFKHGIIPEKQRGFYSGELNIIKTHALDAFISMIYSICISEGIVNRMTSATHIYKFCPHCISFSSKKKNAKIENGDFRLDINSKTVKARFNSKDSKATCSKCKETMDVDDNVKYVLEKCSIIEMPVNIDFEEKI